MQLTGWSPKALGNTHWLVADTLHTFEAYS